MSTSTRQPRHRPALAIVGTGHILPGSSNLEELWRCLTEAPALFGGTPPGRWDVLPHADPACAGTERLPDAPAAYVRDFLFDWRRFRMAPRVAEQLNPMHLMLLHAAGDALAGAEAHGGPLDGERTGFALGTSGLGLKGDYGLRVRMDDFLEHVRHALADGALSEHSARVLAQVRARLDRSLAPILEDNVLMAVASIAQGRVMNHFRLRGPHFAVDVGGASSLAALDAAWDWLADGDADAFLVGGASAWLQPLDLVSWDRARLLASEAPPRPFDEDARGTLLGEGVALFVVQRLSDALRQGRQIHAVIRGLGSASGGRRARPGPPERETYVRAIEQAVREAASDPREVRYVECHAAGLSREDAEELAALAQAFGASETHPLWVGSIKSLMGHLQGGAGSAGLLKAMLAVTRGILPPQSALEHPLPVLGFEQGALRVPRATRPWPEGSPRRAGVTACSESGAVYHLQVEAFEPALHRELAPGRPTLAEPVAVVGLGAFLPDAADVDTFWHNNVTRHDAVREVPPERFDASRYVVPESQDKSRPYSKLGAFVPAVVRVAEDYGVTPRGFTRLDRTQVLALDAATQARRDAGGAWERAPSERLAVIVADAPQREKEVEAAGRVDSTRMLVSLREALEAEGLEHEVRVRILEEVRERFRAVYTPITEDSFQGFQGSTIAARIAHHLGVRGPAVAVESACASSLVATSLAMKGLARGVYDAVLVVGVSASMSPEVLMSVCAFKGISAEGIFPFDERASGFVVGEGAAAVLLRRREDAERAGERIYAVLRGYGGSSDGEGGSVFPPNSSGQAESCRRALAKSGLAPSQVDYIECHGTGTPVGDASEVEAYAQVYGGQRRARPVLLGSVKSLVGHLNAGAGAVGLLRMSKALHQGLLPPTLHGERPNPALSLERGPFEIQQALEDWPTRGDGAPRRAAVSGFGLGGTNFHVILEEHRPAAPRPARVRGETPPLFERLDSQEPGVGRYVRRLGLESDLYLEDHIIGGEPVVPGAMGCEFLAVAASHHLPGRHVVGLEEVRFLQMLRILPGERSALEARVRPLGPRDGMEVVEVSLSTRFTPPGGTAHTLRREHFLGRVLMADRPRAPAHVNTAAQALTHLPGRSYAPLYHGYDYSHLGPRFQSLRSATVRTSGEVIARLEALDDQSLFLGIPEPRLHLNPMLLDNYFQVAGIAGVFHNQQFPLPQRIASMEVWEYPRPGAILWVRARVEEETVEGLRYRLEVFDRMGRLYARLQGFQSYNLRPFSESDLERFHSVLTGRSFREASRRHSLG